MKQYLTLLLSLFSAVAVHAQDAYWQQKVDTRIEVSLNDSTHFLEGHIAFDYYNNSPDTLSFIYMHLWPNAYKNDRTAFEAQAVEDGMTDHYFSKAEERGYIDSLRFTVNEQQAGLVNTAYEDVVKLVLPQPLAPGTQATVSSPFRVKIPLTYSRLGHSGNSYQVSQWFPKPAVYDRKGWHPMPYLNQGEFYSEYGNYDVAITLPENYIVMGTGNLVEASEIAWLDSLSRLSIPDKGSSSQTPASSSRLKTIHFHEENVHDFAWFADKRWVVRQVKFSLPGTQEEITAWNCFSPEHASGWKNSAETIRNTVLEYSRMVGAYPFKTAKVVEGNIIAGGGMEYPTVTVIQQMNEERELNVVIAHEVGHNWFYGMLGSNERGHAWMDEGINSFYEHKVQPGSNVVSKLIGGDRGDLNYLLYAAMSANRQLLPSDTNAWVYPQVNYGADVYYKTAYMLEWLEAYMGADTFQQAMQDYFSSWQNKHPYPEDFENIFRRHSSKNLDWFFKDGLHSSQQVDFKIKSLKQKDGMVALSVKNKTGFEGPAQVKLTGTDAAGQKRDTSVWTSPFTGLSSVQVPGNGIQWREAAIGESVPDFKPDNNLYRKGSTFHPVLKGFFGANLNEVSKTWLLPAIGYNYYDGFMAGIVFHNITVPKNQFQYILMPLYGFGSSTVGGTGIAGYTFYPKQGALHDIQLNVSGKTFQYDKSKLNVSQNVFSRFIKVAPELVLNFKKPYPRSSISRSLSAKAYWIRENYLSFSQDPVDSLYRPDNNRFQDNFYGKLRYQYENKRTLNPFSYVAEGQIGKQFAKISLEARLRIDYHASGKGLNIRGFAGKFFNFSDNSFDGYRYRLATTYTGANDYLYDETYLGRSEQTGFVSQQISEKEGGFKINTLQYTNQVGLSDDWLFTLNLTTDLPLGKLPLRLFADLGTFSGAKNANPSGNGLLYEAGVQVYISDYLTINVPLLMSKDYKDYIDSVLGSGAFGKTISFSINLGNIDWLQAPSKLLQ